MKRIRCMSVDYLSEEGQAAITPQRISDVDDWRR